MIKKFQDYFLFLFEFVMINNLLILFSNISLFANINKWENYTDLKNIISIPVDYNTSKAFCASNGGVFIADLNNGNILKRYTTINGLVNNDITTAILDNQNRLWLGASDGSISILNINTFQWQYIYDIKNSNEFNKSVNAFVLYNNFIFIATGYGIQKISLSNLNFVDAPYYQLGTFNSKTSVFNLVIHNNVIYAATASGIAYAKITNTNLNDPSKWSNYNLAPLNSNVRAIESFDNKIFMGSDNGMMIFDGANWLIYPNPTVSNAPIKFLKRIQNNLYFITSSKIYFTTAENLSEITQFYQDGNYNVLSYDNFQYPIIGTSESGIIANINNNYISVYPNCPFKNSFDKLSIDKDGTLWAAGGQANAGFYKFDGNIWSNYTNTLYPAIGTSNFFRKIYANNGIVWALSFGGGATLIIGENIINYNPSNSTLAGIPENPNFCVPFGGAFDERGYFWISLYRTNNSKSLYVFTGDSNMIGFTNPSVISSGNLEEIAIDNYNTKWIVSGESSPRGLYFFNENNTLDNPSDDIYGFYNLTDFGVDDITDVIVDKNNEVWISSNNGIFIINNPLAAIQNPNNKPAPQKLGIISGNLKVPFTENCRVIRKDVLNNKWIGTQSNGVFHLSSDGTTLLEQFNVDNSPILSNNINTIEINPKNGITCFGTLKGLSTYRTSAIEPLKEFDKITCSPNPFILPSEVELKIDGLIENSIVKIISLNGEIINEFSSPGGRIANWNGTDKKGNLIPSGIYIIVAFNKDGSKVGKGKLAVIKK